MERRSFLKIGGGLLITSLLGLIAVQKFRATSPQRAAISNAHPPTMERQGIELDPQLYDAYVGQYEFEPGKILTITKEDNRLMRRGGGGVKAELFPETETRFFRQDVDMLTIFVKDTAGQVTHLLHQREGLERSARKIA